ncbi:ras responsive element binding [Plakobranchus ocellatus]|uniref:Ras responsive element binding n=1 Tax=Plakobranchus ocellatus TaxID=259542 RepID=A0AAV3Y9U4_9GAST|nr:ras responsive element binding [Plakobranchus ocellatus]
MSPLKFCGISSLSVRAMSHSGSLDMSKVKVSPQAGRGRTEQLAQASLSKKEHQLLQASDASLPSGSSRPHNHSSGNDSNNNRLISLSPSQTAPSTSRKQQQQQQQQPSSFSNQPHHHRLAEPVPSRSPQFPVMQKLPAAPQIISLGATPLLQGIPATVQGLTGMPLDSDESVNGDSRMTELQSGNRVRNPVSTENQNAETFPIFKRGTPMEVMTKSGEKATPGSGKSGVKGGQLEAPQDQTDTRAVPRPGKAASGKGSSSESDSSCDLASVKKILDATDAQRFQEFLLVAQHDVEQGYRSESIASGEDSNTSLENMYSKSLNSTEPLLSRPTPKDTSLSSQPGKQEAESSQPEVPAPETNMPEEEDEENSRETKSESLPSVTVNVALLDPIVFSKEVYKINKLNSSADQKPNKAEVSDPSNMSEQAIAELIEKVSRENICSPAKKKRNSYADSPHKFSCPYCSRCFPWLSSLNRHLLTHTGQKPFKCPRCPVTFSTKSNRERHLIRKHNVNMLDPASRVTMDRPYKCHVCAFSSFSAQCNLVRHYRDRHPGLTPPPLIQEDTPSSDGETEDLISYEDEEEYNSLAEQASLRGLSDRDIMLQNYSQDSDSNNSSSLTTTTTAATTITTTSNSSSNGKVAAHDTHKKRNAVFTLEPDCEPPARSRGEKLTNGLNGVSHGNNSGLAVFCGGKSGSSTRPGIDDTVLTDTMKNFLDKSVRQAVEDSHRRALEEGSKFVITPAIERHLRCLPGVEDSVSGLDTLTSGTEPAREDLAQCVHCDKEFPNSKVLVAHINESEKTLTRDNEEARAKAVAENPCASRREADEDQGNDDKGSNGRNEDDGPNCMETENIPKLDVSQPSTETSCDNDSDKSLDDRTGDDEDDEDAGMLPEVVGVDYLQRKFYCSVCPKRYWSVLDLRRHMHSHTGERPHECPTCGRRFSLKNSLARHTARHHAGRGDTTEFKPAGNAGIHHTGADAEEADDKSPAGSLASGVDSAPRPACSEDPTAGNGEASAGSDNKSRTSQDNRPLCAKASGIPNGSDGSKDVSESGSGSEVDMLHDLLGVESSTIDQIFEGRDSAASLLGV